ncbi:NAD-dependent epimerase/dehydratase family protein [Aeromicrobium sp. CF3.5]|uniref:NAD-dependent epimerase/dehydratase family protein n=1 Tax=Aeromicrobium sp. CF3.5 TaxID=3373078 RepID=UPI003EE4D4FA
MSTRRSVVTGGGGFIGSHLVRRLLEDGDDVTVLDSRPPPWSREVRFVEGDVRDPDLVASVVGGADVVFHLAAVVGVDQYLRRPLDVLDVNVGGTRAVLDAAVREGVRVVMASTSEVFGKNPAVPWAEDGDRVLGPTSADRWAYASSKGLAEHMVYGFVRQHGLDASIVRYFNVYGPGQRPAFLVSRSIHRALNGLPAALYDSGEQTRCFTYIDDAVEGTVRAAALPAARGEAFNLGATRETSVREVIAMVLQLTGTDPRSFGATDVCKVLGAGYQDLARRVPRTDKARDVLGWEALTSLHDGLVATIDWARSNPTWLQQPDSGAA